MPRFGRKLAVIRGEVEREIQSLVSKRDNVHTHHPYHAWDPVPSLSAASAGNTSTKPLTRPTAAANSNFYFFIFFILSRHTDQPWEAVASDQHREGDGKYGLQTRTGMWCMKTAGLNGVYTISCFVYLPNTSISMLRWLCALKYIDNEIFDK